ncbi:MAG: three-Cys-motif partner protein TcmP [Acidobacteria bacterium]|nr:three-Cys-motif partner protein TcmP [Acidobacteriota bacterium]
MKTSSFFDSPKRWSKRKHRLLGKYLPPFSAKLGSKAPLIYCVDGFAGKAKYDNNQPGSPLLIAQIANKCAAWKKPVTLKLINVEADPENYKSLCYITQSWESSGIVTNLLGKFGEAVPKIISHIGNAPALFFLDPFGPTSVKFADLRPILERNQQATELIINFDVDGLRRIVDSINSRDNNLQASKRNKTNIANVTEIIGSNKWKVEVESGSVATHEREKLLLHEYITNLSSYGYNVASYAVRKDVGKTPKYYLIFCTRHADGIKLMNSFIREEEDELIRDSAGNPAQFLLPSEEFDVVQQETQRRRVELRQLILKYLQENTQTTRGQIRHHFVFERFGEFHDKDYNFTLKELIQDVRLQTGHGRKSINDTVPLTFIP